MPDDGERVAIDLVRERGDVGDEVGHAVLPADRPAAVAVAAQVGRVEAVALHQGVCNTVPVAGVVAPAVDQQHRRLRLVAPHGVVQLQTLRVVVAGFRFDSSTP